MFRLITAVLPGLQSFNGVFLALVVGGFVTAYFWHWGEVSKAAAKGEKKGAKDAIEKVDKANTEATSAGQASASASGKPDSSGLQRSPRYR